MDVLGAQYPPIRRHLNESDSDFRLRIANRHSLRTLGSLPGVVNQTRELFDDLVDIKAALSRNRQNIRIYAIRGDLESIGPADRVVIQEYFERPDTHIAGVEIATGVPDVRPYYVHVVTVYDPARHSAEYANAQAMAQLQAHLAVNERIGEPVWSGALFDAVSVSDMVSTGLQVVEGNPDITDIPAPSLYRHEAAGHWNPVAGEVFYDIDFPPDEFTPAWLVLRGGWTFTPAPPSGQIPMDYPGGGAPVYQAGQIYERQILGSSGSQSIVWRYRAGPADVRVVQPNAFINPDDVNNTLKWFLFPDGYPALKNNFVARQDDLEYEDNPVPALPAHIDYNSASVWHAANAYFVAVAR